MISVLQNCKRCNASIPYSKVNKEKGIYHCNGCDVVSSIYDEREYKPNQIGVQQPGDLKFNIEENDVSIELSSSKMRLPNLKQAGCVIVPIAWIIMAFIFNFGMTVNGVNQGWKLKTFAIAFFIGITALFVRRLYDQRERKLFFQVNPYKLTIYQYKNDQKHILDSFPSYMVDQISVKDLSSKAGKLFSVYVFTKDHKMNEILRGKAEYLPYFKFIESSIETYLGLRDRKVSGEA